MNRLLFHTTKPLEWAAQLHGGLIRAVLRVALDLMPEQDEPRRRARHDVDTAKTPRGFH